MKLAGVRFDAKKGVITKGWGKEYPLAGARAEIISEGGMDRRTTGTRVVGGALIAGPVGAVVGGVAKKKRDMRQMFLAIEGDGFTLLEEIKLTTSGIGAKGLQQDEIKKAYKFAAKLNEAAMRASDPSAPQPGDKKSRSRNGHILMMREDGQSWYCTCGEWEDLKFFSRSIRNWKKHAKESTDDD